MITTWFAAPSLARFGAFCLLACAAAAATPASATNGYFANGYGGASKGLAGAGVAVKTGVLGLAQNPAMGTRVGNQAGFCLTTFAPSRDFDISGRGALQTGRTESTKDIFFIPCGGVNFALGDRAALGLFVFGNGGMNTEYDTNPFVPNYGTASTTPLGVNLEQAFVSANLSFDVTDTLSLGFSPILAVQRFSATGLENFAPFSSDPAHLTNNGDDISMGYGFNLGAVWDATPQWTFGAAYRSRMWMDPFDDYSGLFAEQGDFDIPPVATIGAAFTPKSQPRLTVTAEYQRIFYSDIPALSHSHNPMTTPFGADDGPGFGWKDMDVMRLAAIYRASDKLTLRSGISHASQFIDSDEVVFNILAPATPQWHASVGASYAIDAHWGITGSYTYAFRNSVSGSNAALAPGQKIDLSMEQHELALGVTYRW
ncbi:MAG: outer membrane protein transport protein [Rhodobacteraceae bacterium]|nr:outer membrane protein transport protein [Paracoccaceae bacterium]